LTACRGRIHSPPVGVALRLRGLAVWSSTVDGTV
jgi:hypothetical protein